MDTSLTSEFLMCRVFSLSKMHRKEHLIAKRNYTLVDCLMQLCPKCPAMAERAMSALTHRSSPRLRFVAILAS